LLLNIDKREQAVASFFADLHRSIFDPNFYREAVERSRGRVFFFFFKLLLFTALIMGFSKTYYLVHSERGIAPLVNAMFGEMEIKDGRLVTEFEQPYAVPSGLTAELMNRLVGYSGFFGRLPDNFLVVDTRTPPTEYKFALTGPAILLKESAVDLRRMEMELPYKFFISVSDFKFPVAAVQEFLNRNFASFALNFFLISLFFGFFTMTLSVFFLSLASYVFTLDRSGGYRRFVRLACYAITPVMLGNAFVAASGVSAEWTWHVFIVISTLLMFRAMRHGQSNQNKNTEAV
jgi:hypothetical protein